MVLAIVRFEPSGKNKTITWNDGEHKVNPHFDQPYSFFIAELFEILDGNINRIEALVTPVPYGMWTGWPAEEISPQRLVLTPFHREELSRFQRIQFHACQLCGSRQNRIATSGKIGGRRQNHFVRNHAAMFQTLAVAHDEVGIGDRCAVENLHVGALMELVVARLHDGPRTVIAQDSAAVLDLDDARKKLGRRCRPAVHQHD